MRGLVFRTLAVVLVSGCAVGDPCGEPIYAGKASDEAWMTYLDAKGRVVVDDSKALKLTQPAEGVGFSASAPIPTFTWTTPLTASVVPGVNGKARPKGWLKTLSNLIISEAHAHLPPVTGATHVLEFAVPGRECPVRVFTTELSWQPDEASWAVLKSASGKSVRLTATSMYLRENRVSEGPFRGSEARELPVGP